MPYNPYSIKNYDSKKCLVEETGKDTKPAKEMFDKAAKKLNKGLPLRRPKTDKVVGRPHGEFCPPLT